MSSAPSQENRCTSDRLRIGVLCNGAELAAWQAACIRHIEALASAEFSLLVMNAQPPAPPAPVWHRVRAKLANGLLLWRLYERFIVDRKTSATRTVPLPLVLERLPRIEVEPVRVGKFREAFDEEALDAIKAHSPDVLLRFGFGILTGEILSVPRHGLWSFHHGDPERFRGAPPGFWEIRQGDPVTGVVLQQLTEALDGGVILHAGWFKTNPASYSKSLDRILFGAAHFVARALVDLETDPNSICERQPVKKSGPIYRYPRTGDVLAFLARSVGAWLKDQYISLFRHQQWTIGVVEESPEQILSTLSGSSPNVKGVRWLPEPKGGFLADPFAIVDQHTGQASILAEEFRWDTGIGHISALPWAGCDRSTPHDAIRSDFHLSYPYTLEIDGEMYCAPECSHSSQVTLHRFVRAENRWVPDRVLIDNFPALDPTIFQSGGLWWLFCSDAERGPNEFLCAWYADDLRGEWRPHAANPLKVDIRAARPAGRPFLWQGALIRPAQDCSRVYGGAITFNRILRLSRHDFAEEVVGRLTPEEARYPAGLHTISGLEGQSIVDGARWTFVAEEFRRSIRKKLFRGQ